MKRLIVTAFLMCLSLPAFAQDEVQFIRETMAALNQASSGKVTPEILERCGSLWDMDAFIPKTMVDIRAGLSEDQYQAFSRIFSSLMRRNMMNSSLRIKGRQLKNPTFEIASKGSLETQVRVRATASGRPVTLEYTVARAHDQWRVIDIEIEGALLSRNYRGQFNRIFRQEGFEGLYGRMSRKLNPSVALNVYIE